MPRLLSSLLIALLVIFSMAGCGTPSEVAVVTDRPERTDRDRDPFVLEQRLLSWTVPSGYDTVRAQRFDTGKMWPLEAPPFEYFRQSYDFEPEEAWLERARGAALRFGGFCSASFVSENGLVMTNHHCARDGVTDVSEPGENLLDAGFLAESLDEERRVDGLYVEQMVEAEDVSSRVLSVLRETGDDQVRAQARRQRIEQIEREMNEVAQEQDTTLRVEVVPHYSGAEFKAYTYRRHNDVRLVMAPELAVGYFGGDADNFEYPRHSFDVAFLRVYDHNGEPLQTSSYFPLSFEGSAEDELAFVIGSPGSTKRHRSVSQMLFDRDVTIPQQLEALSRRAEVLEDFLERTEVEEDTTNVRNIVFSVRNTLKNLTGQLEGLQDSYIHARRVDGERQLYQEMMEVDTLRERYQNVLQRIEEQQRSKRATARRNTAFHFFGHEQLDSRILTRGLYGFYYASLRRQGVPAIELEDLREGAFEVRDWPDEVEKEFITIRLQEMRDAFGQADPTIQRLLSDSSPEAVAQQLVDASALTDSARFVEIFEEGYLDSDDPSVRVMQAIGPQFIRHIQQEQSVTDREEHLQAQLARARFALYGEDIPPDANYTLRIADGTIRGYERADTTVAPYTTFEGMYALHERHGEDTAWELPVRWLEAPEAFDRTTPLNLVSTNDITGGNSGSALLNRDLEVVGLIFDSNYEALPNEYIYMDEQERAISVDVRGIVEALEHVYEAEELLEELRSGRLAAADGQE